MGHRLVARAAVVGLVSLAAPAGPPAAATAVPRATGAAITTTTTPTTAVVTTTVVAEAASTTTTEPPATTTAEAATTTTTLPAMTLTASASEGPQGTVIRLSGSGCLLGDGRPAEWMDVSFRRSSPEDGRWYSYSEWPPAPPDGVFDLELTVSPEAFRGAYDIWVTCGESDMILANASVLFTVTGEPATLPSLTVWPLSVHPGGEVGVRGDNCTVYGQPGEKVSVYGFPGEPDIPPDDLTVEPDGSWSGVLTVPAVAAPGTYSVSAQCHAGRSHYNTAAVDLAVEGTPVPPAGPRTRTSLPRTGAAPGLPAAGGLVVVLFGLAALALARRVPHLRRMR